MCLFTWLLNWILKETHFIQRPRLRSCQKHSRRSTLGGRRFVCSTESTLESRWKQERERVGAVVPEIFVYAWTKWNTKQEVEMTRTSLLFLHQGSLCTDHKSCFGVVAFSFSTLLEAQNIFQSSGEQKWCLSYLKNS